MSPDELKRRTMDFAPRRAASAKASRQRHLIAPRGNRYWVYFVASKNLESLYIGVTSDFGTRLREHRNPEPDSRAFTARYHTVALVYYEAFDCIDTAIAREKQLKGWRREKKNALVEKMNPRWEDLSGRFADQRPRIDAPLPPEEMQ